MQREIEIKLTSPVQYAFKGDTVDAKFVMLKAPTARNISDCSFLKKMFTNAAIKAGEHNKKESSSSDSDVDVTGSDVMELVYAFGDSEDIEKAMIAAKKIFKDCGELDGEITLTMPLIDEISLDDFELMVGEYIANFIAASMLGKKQKKN